MVTEKDESYVSADTSVDTSIGSNKVELIKGGKVVGDKGVLKLVRETVNKGDTTSFLIIASIINVAIEI